MGGSGGCWERRQQRVGSPNYRVPHPEAGGGRRVRRNDSPARPKSIMAQVARSGAPGPPLTPPATISSVKVSAVGPSPQVHTYEPGVKPRLVIVAPLQVAVLVPRDAPET